MRFWTVQPYEIWEQMERGDAVRVDPDHPKYGGTRPWQYEWLSAALARISPGFDGGWPWWLSCREPDLDALRSTTLPGGREQASVELELPPDEPLPRGSALPSFPQPTEHAAISSHAITIAGVLVTSS